MLTIPEVLLPDAAVAAPGAPAPRWGQLLTAEEVAVYLRCHVSTVYDLVNSGRLKAFSLTGNANKNKRGKKGLRILASSVDDLVSRALLEMTGAADAPAPPADGKAEPATAVERPQAVRGVTGSPRPRGSRVVLPVPAGMS